MLELPNFGHLATSTIQFESRDKIWMVMPLTEIMTLYFFISKYFYLKKTYSSNFLLKQSKLLSYLLKKSLKTQNE